MLFLLSFLLIKSNFHFCNVEKGSHEGGVYDANREIYSVRKKEGFDVEPVYLERNEAFTAHTKCIHAGGEATLEKSDIKYTLKDGGETKHIADVSLYFHFTLNKEHYGSDTRKVEFRK